MWIFKNLLTSNDFAHLTLACSQPAWTLLSRIVNLTRQLKPEYRALRASFVAGSVHSLLKQLYYDLDIYEEELSESSFSEDELSESSSSKQNLSPVSSYHAEFVMAVVDTSQQTDMKYKPSGKQKFFVERNLGKPEVNSANLLSWIKEIYFPPDGGDVQSERIFSPVRKRQTPRPRIFGPVGERPLHVCFLRANEFKLESEEDRDIRRGILEGAKSFIMSCNPLEVTVPHGKDYCAAVGSIVLKDMIRNPDSTVGKPDSKKQQPSLAVSEKIKSCPYFKRISDWAKQIYRPPKKGKNKEFHRTISVDSEKLVSTGLYEGETVLYFSIASRDLESTEWLLEHGCK
jgi:hypothetical protein